MLIKNRGSEGWWAHLAALRARKEEQPQEGDTRAVGQLYGQGQLHPGAAQWAGRQEGEVAVVHGGVRGWFYLNHRGERSVPLGGEVWELLPGCHYSLFWGASGDVRWEAVGLHKGKLLTTAGSLFNAVLHDTVASFVPSFQCWEVGVEGREKQWYR